MLLLENHFGQPTYIFENKNVTVRTTVQAGHLTASFKSDALENDPFFIAPWYNEQYPSDFNGPWVGQVLRGSFFCLPFGWNVEPFEGRQYQIQGAPANACWHYDSFSETADEKKLVQKTGLDFDNGLVHKQILLREGEPVIYERDIVSGYSGKTSVAFHPSLKLPEKVGAARLDISKPIAVYSSPIPVEEPINRGYSLLEPGVEIEDITKAPCIDGSTIDLTVCPVCRGYEDVVHFISDTSRAFSYSCVTYPEGYLYFQIKNPKMLTGTMLWMSNGGRHFEPWNGRVTSVLGIEEAVSYFYLGIKASVENNAFMDKGYKTYVEMHASESYAFSIIMGMIPVKEGYKGVRDIVKKDESTITIIGVDGSEIDVPCQVGFVS